MMGHRAFSLANSPSTGNEIELNIRIVPGGAGTTWIHNELKVGDRSPFRPLRPLLRAQVGQHRRCSWPAAPACPARGR
jgi:ferredoxin-NADP reductase